MTRIMRLARNMSLRHIFVAVCLITLAHFEVGGCGGGGGSSTPGGTSSGSTATVSIAATMNAAEEGTVAGTFTVTLSSAASADTTINYTVSGTALASDFSALSGTVLLTAGSTTATITVTPIDDALNEGDETVTITLSTGAGYELGTTTSATITLTDNDRPTVSIAATDAIAAELGTETGEFTISLSAPATEATTVNYVVTGTATAANDYATLAGSISFAIGESSKTVTVTPIDDVLDEGNETVILTLQAGSNFDLGTTEATVNIQDDERVTVSVVASTATAEEDGPVSGQFQIQLTKAAVSDLTIDYTITGTATSGTDFTALAGSVTITAGDTTADIDVVPIDDTTMELDETVIMTLQPGTYELGAPTVASVTIESDDMPIASAVASDASASETGPNSGTVNITLSEAFPADLTVHVQLNGTATLNSDYTIPGVTATAFTVIMPAGATTAPVVVTPIDDASYGEGDETVEVHAASGPGYAIGPPNFGTITITDNDIPQASIAATDPTANETGETGTFTISLDQTAAADLAVSYTASGTATAGTDYTALSGAATVAAGTSSTSITLTAIDDALDEGDESVTLTLSAGAGYTIGTSSATGTIRDDERVTVAIVATTADAYEAGPVAGEFEVQLSKAAVVDLTINYSITGSATEGTDCTALTGTVSITAGNVTAPIAVTPIDDALMELDETVVATLESGSYHLGTLTTATVTIHSDDVPEASIAVANSDTSEGGGINSTITVTLSEAFPADVNVNVRLSGTATYGDDYTVTNAAAADFVITVPAGDTTATATLSPVDDTVYGESPETIRAEIQAGTNYSIGSPAACNMVISDNDVLTATITASNADASEEGPATGAFTISLDHNASFDTTISYTMSGTATSGTDYTLGTATISAGSSAVIVALTPVDDSANEGAETAIMTLNAGTGYILGTTTEATVTIADNDRPTVTIAATDADAAEVGPDTGTFTIALSIPATEAITVNYTTGGSATNASDYTALTGTVSFATGEDSKTVTVTPIDDSSVEANETVVLTIAAGSYDIGTDDNATVTIASDDIPSASIAAAKDAEEEATVAGTFTVTMSEAPLVDTTVTITLSGTATQGTDYSVSSTSATVLTGQTTATITVIPVDDPTDEPDETIVATLNAGAGYSLGTTPATINLIDNEVILTNITATTATVPENGPGTGLFTIELDQPAPENITVQYTVSGNAVAGTNYVALGTASINAGETSTTLTVTPIDDSSYGVDKRVIVTLNAAIGYTLDTSTSATVTITENEIGHVWTFGSNADGELGLGLSIPREPEKVRDNVQSVSVSHSHGLVLLNDGTLLGMGSNGHGQLGTGDTITRTSPVVIATSVTSIAAGNGHTVFVKTDGSLWAIGYNDYGQLGTGDETEYSTPQQILSSGVASVICGQMHTLIIKTDATLWGAGYNPFGQLGLGDTTDRNVFVQIDTNVAAAAPGSFHTIYLKTDGTLHTVGRNNFGQLGTGDTTDRSTPIQIDTSVSGIATGSSHSLYIKTDGSLWGMGYNTYGQLGNGGYTAVSTPEKVVDSGVVSAAAGHTHSLFVKSDGSLWGMGNNDSNQLLVEGLANQNTPTQLVVSGVQTVDAKHNTSSYVSNGSQWFGGDDSYHQSGRALKLAVAVPAAIGFEGARVAAGEYFSLFLKANGELWGMGRNYYKVLGPDTSSNKLTPVLLDTGVIDAAAGTSHALYIKADGSLWGLGSNSSGQIAAPAVTTYSTPFEIQSSGVAHVAAGRSYSFFIRTDGTLWAMGLNSSGQLGTGDYANQTTPVQIATDVISVDGAVFHSMFVKSDGTLWAMGANTYGQFGTGNKTNSTSPIQVATGVSQVTTGWFHSMFVKTDGTLWGMGSNSSGQLGTGDKLQKLSPVQVMTDVASVSAGHWHNLILKTDGSLWGTGNNSYNQIGVEGATEYASPVQIIASGVKQASAGATHSMVIRPNSALPMAEVALTDPQAGESANTAKLTFMINRAATTDLTINYSISGTASSEDYSNLAGTITIPAGEHRVTVDMTATDDADVEGDETVIVTLTSDAAYQLGTSSTATITIKDND